MRAIGQINQPVLGLAGKLLSPFKPKTNPTLPATGFQNIPPTPPQELTRILQNLQQQHTTWANLPTNDRAQLLQACLENTLAVLDEASVSAAQVKGSSIGDEMLSWVPIISSIREYIEALHCDGQPKPMAIRKHSTRQDQMIVDVFPFGLEALVWGGFKGEIWIQPGKEVSQGGIYNTTITDSGGEKEEEKESIAATIKEKRAGGIALVLGAGNQQAVAALDILHKLLIENEVVICKMNPVNEYQGPFLRRALLPLVNRGFVEFVYGGGDVGKQLVEHPLVKSIHLTGSEATYNAIVWGGTQQKEAAVLAKKKGGGGAGSGSKRLLQKHVGAELGCVTPYIIVPGQHWSKDDMRYHADNIAAGLTNNAGHNCLKVELVVTDKEWPQREEFLKILRERIDAHYPKYAYYPGSEKKFEDFKKKFPDAEELGRSREGMGDTAGNSSSGNSAVKCNKWLLKTGLSPEQADTATENWIGVLQEVALPDCAGDASIFMSKAVSFVNDQCWGSLSCSLTIHPATKKQHYEAYNKAISDLKYGSITVNLPTLLGFAITRLGWGAWGGEETGGTPDNIGSGNCFVHNTMMFEHVEKSVLYGPFRFNPQPPVWSGMNRNLDAISPALARFSAKPNLWRLLALARQAALG